MGKVLAYVKLLLPLLLALGVLVGCSPAASRSEQAAIGAQEGEPPAATEGADRQAPSPPPPVEPRLEAGEIRGVEQLQPTEEGFRRWEWWFRGTHQIYNPYREVFVARTTEEPISVLEYWHAGEGEEPDTGRLGWREDYDEAGRRVQRSISSREHGYEYERFRYDAAGRLVELERRSSVQDAGFESATVWPEYSYTLRYYRRSDGVPGVYRVATDFTGRPYRLERERELDSGWEYVYDPSSGEPTILSVEIIEGRLKAVTIDFGDGDKKVLSFEYGLNTQISKTIETKLDGTTPLFSTDYTYDAQGRMTAASTWDHRTNKQERVRTFSDHDERGHWRRAVTRIDGKVVSIEVRRLEYRP